MKDNFQDQLLEKFMVDDNKNNENVDKVMLLTTELLEKDKTIDIMINNIGENNEELLMIKTK